MCSQSSHCLPDHLSVQDVVHGVLKQVLEVSPPYNRTQAMQAKCPSHIFCEASFLLG